MADGVKLTRRQRLDEDYRPLLDTKTQEPLCSYGPSLITVIFNAQTIVDATLFFISGAHKRFTIPHENLPEVISVQFSNPRIPSFFTSLLPEGEEPAVAKKSRRPRAPPKANQRARKRCAFFNILVSRRGIPPNEPEVVNLSADIKLFHYTAHVCGLRSAPDAELVMRVIDTAFSENQALLDRYTEPSVLELLSAGDEGRASFLRSNNRCCTTPLVLSEGDVVMTNVCGKFSKTLNLRETYKRLTTDYPGVLCYLTTMSKSNYLAITLFEQAPFYPLTEPDSSTPEIAEILKAALRTYLMSNKKNRAKFRKHTFFIYASGRFIQSSRNNATSLEFTANCMRLLHSVTIDLESPEIAEDGESTTVAAGEEASEESHEIEDH